jgi:hypothetical protein
VDRSIAAATGLDLYLLDALEAPWPFHRPSRLASQSGLFSGA